MEKITNPEKNIIETNIILSNKMFMKTDEAQSIANDIKHGSIVNINISDVSIKEDDLNIMIEAIKNNPHSIKNLRLHNCDIGDNQAKNIAEILKKSNSIETLDLSVSNARRSRTVITDTGAKAIAIALKENKSLKILNLSSDYTGYSTPDYGIGNSGAKDIAEALQNHPSIKELNLSSFHIKDDGLIAIANLLKTNTTITDVNLAKCNMSDKGFKAIEQSLLPNLPWKEVILPNNQFYSTKDAKRAREKYIDTMINDMKFDYAKSIVLPQLYLNLNSIDKENKPESYNTLKEIITKGLHFTLTENILFKNLDKDVQLALANQWIRSKDSLDTEKALSTSSLTDWPALLSEEDMDLSLSNEPKFNGWKVRCLTTPKELVTEGKELGHCLATYVDKCCYGDSHILSIRDPGSIENPNSITQPISFHDRANFKNSIKFRPSTMEVKFVGNNSNIKWEVKQHLHSRTVEEADPINKEIEVYLLKKLQNVTNNYFEQARKNRSDERFKHPDIEEVGYDYTNKKSFTEINHLYQKIGDVALQNDKSNHPQYMKNYFNLKNLEEISYGNDKIYKLPILLANKEKTQKIKYDKKAKLSNVVVLEEGDKEKLSKIFNVIPDAIEQKDNQVSISNITAEDFNNKYKNNKVCFKLGVKHDNTTQKVILEAHPTNISLILNSPPNNTSQNNNQSNLPNTKLSNPVKDTSFKDTSSKDEGRNG